MLRLSTPGLPNEMNPTVTKKEIAAQVGITPRTMRNHPEKWSWLKQCRSRATKRPTYRRACVAEELRRRGILP